MAKSTVRFPEEVLAFVEQYIDDGEFTSKSEFQRFAVEYLLVQLEAEYEPTMVEFDEIRQDVLETSEADTAEYIETAESSDFLRTASRVRQYAVRGDIETAYELIDTRCAPESPRAMLLDLVVQGAASTQT
jgi:Arc/MetJ-type ribon-helix-helix transcriptional regulator